VLQKLIGLVFNEAVSRMVGAFETRAIQIYGDRNLTQASRSVPLSPGGEPGLTSQSEAGSLSANRSR
jgi:hypothetical protein